MVGNNLVFNTTAAPLPIVATNLPADVATTSATLIATVNPNGEDTGVRFLYGPTPSYGQETAVQPIGSGTSPVPVSAPVTGLEPDTPYNYAVRATSPYGANTGGNVGFVTLPGPLATTGGVLSATATTASLTGVVDPNGQPTTYSFHYGNSPALGSETTPGDAGSGDAPVDVSAELTGLAPYTTYFYELQAENWSGRRAAASCRS